MADDGEGALDLEAGEAPAASARQIDRNRSAFAALGARLRAAAPRFVVTCARGSSDHAALYGKALIETRLGRVVASVGPGVASVYHRQLAFADSLFVVVSQSGRSPDLISLTRAARDGGALVVGFLNDAAAPLADQCEVVVPLSAGRERAVAATKSYLLSGQAFLSLVAHWSGAADLLAAVETLPEALAAAAARPWWPALAPLAAVRGLYVLGPGPSFGAAAEVALKFKETCGLHAEAFSAAEVRHGPWALVGPDLPVLVLGQEDEAAPLLRETVTAIESFGARCWSALAAPGAEPLPTVPGLSPVVAPLCQVLSLYRALTPLAGARGRDADHPAHLAKITRTQ